MEEQIDVESALEDAIFELTEVEDMRDPGDMRRKVASVLDECLLPALKAVKSNEKRMKVAKERLGAELFETACAINRVATVAARNDPTVIPVLRALDCKVAKLSAPELLASIKPEVRDAE
jgi:hypothetical protein